MPTNQAANLQVVNAKPSKIFFTETLPRDIPLSDCILDLVDNSVHSLVTRLDVDVSQNLFAGTTTRKLKGTIDISFSSSKFTMTDDCGGISIDDAKNHVFRLGTPADNQNQAGLGVYGIGMKRAFFKMGKSISVTSHTRTESFGIDIDVDAWVKKENDWDLPLTYARKEASKTSGTSIRISELLPAVSEHFTSKGFKALLLEKVSRAFALFLKAGLKITINGTTPEPDVPELAESNDLQPIRHMLKKSSVDILIMAGLSPRDDRTPRGWYIFCNGRMVLDADKTERTGWGVDSHPIFHVKFNHFLGYVYFRSKDLWKLPWTTTKDGVDRESPIYQLALNEMRLQSRPVLDFLNTFYEDVREPSEPERTVFAKAKAVSPLTVAKRSNTSFQIKVHTPGPNAVVSIQYKRPSKKVKEVATALGKSNLSASRIGEHTFDWFYDRNCK